MAVPTFHTIAVVDTHRFGLRADAHVHGDEFNCGAIVEAR
jgi:hypothetical protein